MKTSIEQDNAGFRVLTEAGLLYTRTIDRETLTYSGYVKMVDCFTLFKNLHDLGINDVTVIDHERDPADRDGLDLMSLTISLAP